MAKINPVANLLTTILGIGPLVAMVIVAEVEDIKHFRLIKIYHLTQDSFHIWIQVEAKKGWAVLPNKDHSICEPPWFKVSRSLCD